MSTLPAGVYEIQCVLLNSETVLNDETVRRLEIRPDYWLLQPAEQRFDVVQRSGTNLVLESNGQTFYAESSIGDDAVKVELKKSSCQETIAFDLNPQAAALSTALGG